MHSHFSHLFTVVMVMSECLIWTHYY